MINTILKQQGWNEGLSEGKLNQSRDLVLMLLPKRLGAIPTKLEQTIRNTHDLNHLQAVLASLLELQSWQEVEQLLNAETKIS